jgi:hypothetical protein
VFHGIVLSGILLYGIMLSVILLHGLLLSAILLYGNMLSGILLSVVAPFVLQPLASFLNGLHLRRHLHARFNRQLCRMTRF